MLQNGGFENGWQDLPPTASGVTNQQPDGWRLAWVARGGVLYDDAGATAGDAPVCVHMLSRQLPPHEHRGAADALILDGDTTYKIFHSIHPFGATLAQTVTGLAPGAAARLVVPVRAHLHGDGDPFSAESGVWVNGRGGWANGGDMGDRRWYRHTVEFVVPADGRAEIVIRVKSKWPRPKDFFLDAVTLEAVAAPTPPPPVEPPAPSPALVVRVSVPAGLQVVREVGGAPGVVRVVAPPGVEVRVDGGGG